MTPQTVNLEHFTRLFLKQATCQKGVLYGINWRELKLISGFSSLSMMLRVLSCRRRELESVVSDALCCSWSSQFAIYMPDQSISSYDQLLPSSPRCKRREYRPEHNALCNPVIRSGPCIPRGRTGNLYPESHSCLRTVRYSTCPPPGFCKSKPDACIGCPLTQLSNAQFD